MPSPTNLFLCPLALCGLDSVQQGSRYVLLSGACSHSGGEYSWTWALCRSHMAEQHAEWGASSPFRTSCTQGHIFSQFLLQSLLIFVCLLKGCN